MPNRSLRGHSSRTRVHAGDAGVVQHKPVTYAYRFLLSGETRAALDADGYDIPPEEPFKSDRFDPPTPIKSGEVLNNQADERKWRARMVEAHEPLKVKPIRNTSLSTAPKPLRRASEL